MSASPCPQGPAMSSRIWASPNRDVDLAKAELAIRVHRLAEHRRLTPDEAAALLKVPKSELAALFQGRLATCLLDQLVRMLTWLGDDVEILIRPRLQRTKRGALRVLQAAAVEKPDDFEPARQTTAHETPHNVRGPRRFSSSPRTSEVEPPTPSD